MSTLFAAQRPLPLIFSILITVLAIGNYFIPRDFDTITINPAGWIVWSAFLWGVFATLTATQFRTLRSLDMPQKIWQRATHGVIICGSVVFGIIAAAAHYVAQGIGVPVDSSFEVYFDSTPEVYLPDGHVDYAAAQPDWRLIALTVLGFIVTYLLAGYMGAGTGLLFASLHVRGLPAQILALFALLVLVYWLALLASKVIYAAVGYVSAPFPGLFVFGGIAVTVGALLVWRLPQHVHP